MNELRRPVEHMSMAYLSWEKDQTSFFQVYILSFRHDIEAVVREYSVKKVFLKIS